MASRSVEALAAPAGAAVSELAGSTPGGSGERTSACAAESAEVSVDVEAMWHTLSALM